MNAVVGILGAGQLGCMLAEALTKLGASVRFYDPDADAPGSRRFAPPLGAPHLCAPWTDAAALSSFFSACDVVTLEFENIDPAHLDAVVAQTGKRLHPAPAVLRTTQNRLREKEFCKAQGLPRGVHAQLRSPDHVRSLWSEWRAPFVVKRACGGYDGKGQWRVDDAAAATAVSAMLSSLPDCESIAERLLPLALELSVIVARDASGTAVAFPPFRNLHRKGILDLTTFPAEVSPELASKATEIALRAATVMEATGLFTTEFFVVSKGEADDLVEDGVLVPEGWLTVNEFAPRAHNSGHVSRIACNQSQFDLQARLLLGLPLCAPAARSPGRSWAMANLLGDCALASVRFPLEALFPWPAGLCEIVDYGKNKVLPARKMGHLCAEADNAQAAAEIALRARGSLQAANGKNAKEKGLPIPASSADLPQQERHT